jgi:hypothetical protein
MTPAELLQTMRSRGYVAHREGDRLVVEGPPPKDAERASHAIVGARDQLLALLDAESHPTVKLALEVFPGARLVDVRPSTRGAK